MPWSLIRNTMKTGSIMWQYTTITVQCYTIKGPLNAVLFNGWEERNPKRQALGTEIPHGSSADCLLLHWLLPIIILPYETYWGTHHGDHIALASDWFRTEYVDQSLRATSEESTAPSGRTSLLIKKGKHNETVHHSSYYGSGYMRIRSLQGSSYSVTRLKTKLTHRRWQSQELPRDETRHTVLFISIFSKSPQECYAHSEVPYMFVELMNKYMTIKYILKAIFKLLKKTEILNE